MWEDQEELSITQKMAAKRTPGLTPDLSAINTVEVPNLTNNHHMKVLEESIVMPAKQMSFPTPIPSIVQPGKLKNPKSTLPKNRRITVAQAIRDQCQQLCLSAFFREHTSVRSLGFTSSIAGEGKSFLALVTAEVMANSSGSPVSLVECNWEHSSVADYLGLPATPGLAEWLRNECNKADMCYQVSENLTVVPAGKTKQDTLKLLQQIRQSGGLIHALASPNEYLIVDLPAIATNGYGLLAASLVESLVIVVRAGVTSDLQVAETCSRLKDLPVQGIVLNEVRSRIPVWLQRLLS